MNSKYCIILIHEFPYFNGETFFDSELQYLSKSFDKIIIFSILGNNKLSHNRKIPENVVIVPLGVSNGKITNFYKGLFTKNIKRDHYYHRSKLKYRLFSTFARGKIDSSSSKITKWLDDNKSVLLGKDIIIYSYWLNLAYTGFLAKEFLTTFATTTLLITRAHGYDVYSERKNIPFIPYQFEAMESVDYVFPISKNGEHYLSNKFSIKKNQINHYYLGVTQNKKMTNHDKHVFATCSVIRPIKQIDLFAKAFCSFVNYNPSFKWICIGGGRDLAKIYSIVKKHNCLDKVLFTHELSNEEVIDCMIRNNVGYFFNVSKHEGLPVTLMEAQSLSIPCIATSVGGSSEIVNDDNGILIPPVKSEDDIIRAMKMTTQINDIKYNEMSELSFLSWKKNFNADINYSRWANNLSTKIFNNKKS